MALTVIKSAGTVTSNAQPNITSVGTLTSLAVIGNALFTGANVSLGNVSNLKIEGGTADYVLKTDGTGNLAWAAQTGGGGGGSIAVQDEGSNIVSAANAINFVGTGVLVSNVGGVATVTVSGGGGGGSSVVILDEGTILTNAVASINFSGTGVTATTSGDAVTVTIAVRTSNNGATTSGNITPTADTADLYNILGLTGAITILAPSGTPLDGQRLLLRIKDDGVGARGITWTTVGAGSFRSIGVTLPATTTLGKILYVGCVYNSQDSVWDTVAVTIQS